MSLRAINLNLLPILQALVHERNVSRAAQTVGITQSAASKALAQLRLLLDDPLLIRVGNRLVLSKRGELIRSEVDEALNLVGSMLRRDSFTPMQSARDFTISCIDFVALNLMTLIDERIGRDAPHIRLQFVDLPLSGSWGHVDFAILPRAFLDRLTIPDARSTPLFKDELVWIRPRGAGLCYDRSGEGEPPLIFQIERPGGTIIDLDANQPYRPRVTGSSRYSVQQFALFPYLSLLLDAPAQIPRSLFELLAPLLPLQSFERAVDADPMEFVLAWRAPLDRDPAHRWLRRLIEEALGAGTASTAPPTLTRSGTDADD